MTPKFAKAVDPIFTQVIELLERIQEGEKPDPEEEQRLVVYLIDQADRSLAGNEDWNVAKYAFACWIDEMLIQAPWTPGSNWWKNNPLERRFYTHATQAYYQFYEQATLASQLRTRDALEVYYVCVMLGFRGFYQQDPASASADAVPRGLPATLKEWTDRTRMNIVLGGGRVEPREEGQNHPGAPALQGFNLLVWTLMAGVFLTAIAVALGVQYITIALG